ncbi:chromosome segregation protein SMC [Loktanella sp. SALINAS62]|uniref:chromosome segregation protein SMC n=1 Tax=Loktanella sp. SALINAS62 TaxID=2706124 RepID=UPI001B8AF90C|nr:chromosome segregation protein SMC [Loktanella sp. SALINAS62]MBS1300941.1 chromosome segregation protein SMC [Loktanella sp. SALINAS62]
MRFTRLRLNGFKSFVDPTDLVIADGLTGVVGPNGCGKSNLLEALRWVMGENRASAMRGGGMEDVIFAGTATRPARNFAEVVLQIDNGERLAPAAFNDSDSLDITRRITRDAGSAYKVGTKDVRARDVQMLFADASTGAHSPALVRQGQISELINAKPKSRRRILEEAAGISGLYQRRHEAELKLKGAESNLARVDDVIAQLASQLGTLARQARQAARYREIGTALRQSEGLLLYRRWKDADAALATARDALRDRTTQAVRAETAATLAAKARAAADDALPALREEDAIAGALTQRLLIEQDRLDDADRQAVKAIEALTARIAQLSRDIAREVQLNADAGDSVAALEAEQAELDAAGAGHDDALAQAQSDAAQAAAVLGTREAELGQATEDAARLAARHQSAQRLAEDCMKRLAQAESLEQQAKDTVATATATLADLARTSDAARKAEETASDTARRAEETLVMAEAARAKTQVSESDARAARSAAEGEAAALRAEVAALARLVDRDRGDTTALLDALTVVAGFERALGAALSDDLKAPLVTGDAATGWVRLDPYDDVQALPANARPLAQVVQGAPELNRRLAQVGLVDAAEGARLQADLRPGQRLVSVQGDLWRWDGLRVGAADAPSTAALRLEQVNRLAALRGDLDRAETTAADARAAHEKLATRLKDLTDADRHARDARRAADAQVTDARRAASRAEADRDLAQSKRDASALAQKRHADDATAARAELRQAQAAVAGLDDPSAARAVVDDLRVTVEAARMTLMTRRAAADEVRSAGDARAARQRAIAKDLTGWRTRLGNAAGRLDELQSRKAGAETDLATAQDAPKTIGAQRAALSEQIVDAEKRQTAARAALSLGDAAARDATRAERDAERTASDAREARATAEARKDAAQETVDAIVIQIRDARDVTPAALLDALVVDPDTIPDAARIETDVAAHKRQRDALGAVNLRAEEDSRAVQSEHDTLVAEKRDLEDAIAALRSGIASLNREGRERLLTAFEQVNESFGTLFVHLFGGGEARLVLVESDDPLDAGLEIMCQPPGKKLSTLSLLSGGEQTLTAMALIFAVFLANPAPICVLDEVDAPLDDANVTRFCDLLDEMTRRTDTRFLIITHHAVTMSRMDRLFGVTMGEQGVSQLVSVDLKKAEQMVA